MAADASKDWNLKFKYWINKYILIIHGINIDYIDIKTYYLYTSRYFHFPYAEALYKLFDDKVSILNKSAHKNYGCKFLVR
jgi:hypothetical protein